MLPTIRKQNLNWLPSVFTDFFNDDWFPLRATGPTVPAINVKENEKEFDLEMAVPGISKEDLHVHVNDKDQLVVSVEKKEEKKEEEKTSKFLRREFNFTHFEQTLLLPEIVDREAITAKVCHGVLHIKLPKLENIPIKESTRMIEIQ
jgi:HSP20 family protein